MNKPSDSRGSFYSQILVESGTAPKILRIIFNQDRTILSLAGRPGQKRWNIILERFWILKSERIFTTWNLRDSKARLPINSSLGEEKRSDRLNQSRMRVKEGFKVGECLQLAQFERQRCKVWDTLFLRFYLHWFKYIRFEGILILKTSFSSRRKSE